MQSPPDSTNTGPADPGSAAGGSAGEAAAESGVKENFGPNPKQFIGCIVSMPSQPPPPADPSPDAGWRVFAAADGRPYYYNSATGLSQWQMPPALACPPVRLGECFVMACESLEAWNVCECPTHTVEQGDRLRAGKHFCNRHGAKIMIGGLDHKEPGRIADPVTCPSGFHVSESWCCRCLASQGAIESRAADVWNERLQTQWEQVKDQSGTTPHERFAIDNGVRSTRSNRIALAVTANKETFMRLSGAGDAMAEVLFHALVRWVQRYINSEFVVRQLEDLLGDGREAHEYSRADSRAEKKFVSALQAQAQVEMRTLEANTRMVASICNVDDAAARSALTAVNEFEDQTEEAIELLVRRAGRGGLAPSAAQATETQTEDKHAHRPSLTPAAVSVNEAHVDELSTILQIGRQDALAKLRQYGNVQAAIENAFDA